MSTPTTRATTQAEGGIDSSKKMEPHRATYAAPPADDAITAAPPSETGWGLWGNQILSILRLEAARNLFSKRSVLIYLMTALPLLLLLLTAIIPMDANEWQSHGGRNRVFAVFYEAFVLRTLIFFGCAWIFMNLIRGEVVDRSLHYYFLAPVRRAVFVIGKYLAGVMTAWLFFGTMTLLALLLVHLPHQSVGEFISDNGGAALFAYTGTTLVACIGYGALFLLIGLYFRNPVIPALVIYGWEWINFLLPPLLKKLSVIHYLHSLVPIPIGFGPFEVLAEPTPAYIGVPGLLLFVIIALLLSARRARRMEILYGND